MDLSASVEPVQSNTVYSDEDEDICRICRCGAEEDRPLYHPCVCAGSIKYVHQDCLMQWLSHTKSSKMKCELCGHRFGFTPLYLPGAPENLPVQEVSVLFFQKAFRYIPYVSRLSMVAFSWGFLVPFVTCVLFRILSLNSWSIGSTAPTSGWDVLWGCFELTIEDGLQSWSTGLCVNIFIALSFFALLSVIDFVRFHQEEAEEVGAEHWQGNENQVEQQQDPVDARENNEQNVIPDNEIEQGEDASPLENDGNDLPLGLQPRFNPNDGDNNVPDYFAGADQDYLDGYMMEQQGNNNAEAAVQNVDQADVQEELEGEADNQENAPAPAVVNPIPNVAEGDFDAGDGMEINIALDEILGLRGPMFVILHNIMWLLTFEGFYLFIALAVPTALGSVVMKGFSKFSHAVFGIALLSKESIAFLARQPVVTQGDDSISPIFPWFERYLENQCPFSPRSELDKFRNLYTVMEPQSLGSAEQLFTQSMHNVSLEVGAVACGYLSEAFFAFFLLQLAKILKSNTTTSQNSENSLGLALLDNGMAFLNVVCKVSKVTVLLVFKMGVLPVSLGILLENCTRPLFTVSLESRYWFILSHPVISLLIAWVVGISHMLFITVVILQLREVLHPDILYGLIRPFDPNVNLLRTLLQESFPKQVRRMVISCTIYTLLILFFVFIPVQICTEYFTQHWVPISPNLNYISIELQLPIELVVLHIGMLNFLENYKNVVFWGQQKWLELFCYCLGLTRMLLPIDAPEDKSSTESNNGGAQPQQNGQNNNVQRPNGFNRFNFGGIPNQPTMDNTTRNLLPRLYPSFAYVRVGVLIVCAWASSLCMSIFSILIPYFIGQSMVDLFQFPKRFQNDIHLFLIGWLIVWRFCVGLYNLNTQKLKQYGAKIVDTVRNEGLKAFKRLIQGKGLAFSTSILCVFFVIPMIVGFGLEIYVFQLDNGCAIQDSKTITNEETFALSTIFQASKCMKNFSFLKMWTLGILSVFIVVHVLDSYGAFLGNINRLLPIVGVQRAFMDLLQFRRCKKFLKKVVYPMLLSQSVVVFVPILAAFFSEIGWMIFMNQSLFAFYGYFSFVRHCALLVGFLSVIPIGLLYLQVILLWGHDILRDEKYLVGRQLHNLESRLNENNMM